MPRRLCVIILTIVTGAAACADAFACGDKFLRVGRSARFRAYASVHPSSILVYAPRWTRHGIVGAMKLRGAIVLLAVALLGASSASAQEYRGTSDQQSACMSDVFRLCSGEIPDVGRIVACLKRERPRLSDGCRSVFGGASTRVAANHRAILKTFGAAG